MNADPATQARLLELQAADTVLAQLAHRRKSLPELAEIAARTRTADALNNDVVDARTTASDIMLEQQRVETDVDAVRTRAARDEARLQAGGLPARELESLQHELVSLARRQSTLEDEVLEIMERAEEAEARLTDSTAKLDAVDRERDELVLRRNAAFAEIDAAIETSTPRRSVIAESLPADLVAAYEKARQQSGTGAALLRQRRCEGCRIELSGSELSSVRKAAPDAIVKCENCRTILVRTSESGL